jgi:hypothetical protein
MATSKMTTIAGRLTSPASPTEDFAVLFSFLTSMIHGKTACVRTADPDPERKPLLRESPRRLAVGGDGVWSEVPTSFAITIRPPWWRTWA